MPTDNREIYQLATATTATDDVLIPAAEGSANAKGIGRVAYCRISAITATSTKLFNQNLQVSVEADAAAITMNAGTATRFFGDAANVGVFLLGGAKFLGNGSGIYVNDLAGNNVLKAEAADTELLFGGAIVFDATSTMTRILFGGVTRLGADATRSVMVSPDTARNLSILDTGLIYSSLTASRVCVTDGSNFIVSSSVTTTVLNYITNVTSDVQVQINNINTAIALTLNDLGTASGAQVVDFAYTASKLIANGNVTLTSSNRVTADSTNIRILASGADRTVTPSASWKWTGADLSAGVVVPSGKQLTISLFLYGTAETDVTASGSIQP